MDDINTDEAIKQDRRRFFGAAALSLTAAELGAIGAAHAQTKLAPPQQAPKVFAEAVIEVAKPV
jgi:hypothetical protein